MLYFWLSEDDFAEVNCQLKSCNKLNDIDLPITSIYTTFHLIFKQLHKK